MTSQQTPKYFFPNKMGRIILLAMEEVIGHMGVNAALNVANLPNSINNYPPNDMDLGFAFEDISRILAALEKLYGLRGGRGLALRVGRACFKYGLREFGPMLGSTDLAFRLLPTNTKISTGADLFSKLLTGYTDLRGKISEDANHFLWEIDICPICWERQADSPICHLPIGILQESLYWVSGGKFYNVEETQCIAKGDPNCLIVVDKTPLE
jgi:predicted hydrocarbon binding protein